MSRGYQFVTFFLLVCDSIGCLGGVFPLSDRTGDGRLTVRGVKAREKDVFVTTRCF